MERETDRPRFDAIYSKVLRFLPSAKRSEALDVVDLGCGAGTQCELWAERGHTVHGLDLNERLIAAARQSAIEQQHGIDYRVGSASDVPWPEASMDVCLLAELLEHVPDWERCIDECARLLRAGGILYISTTNRLCPLQQEFELPLYSWYPSRIKRYCERLAVTSKPHLVRGVQYPAVNWFTPAQLCSALRQRGFIAYDRFDMLDVDGRGTPVRALAEVVRTLRPLRWLGHVATRYTSALALKQSAPHGELATKGIHKSRSGDRAPALKPPSCDATACDRVRPGSSACVRWDRR
jgi:2-polyprenyl-6-hydroxyphenyl methylase/3-demethylubiquinone-9 3-methyltransferase